jgi:hypothetical protein
MFAASKSGSPVDLADAQFNYVTMLLHGDGTNGAQNNTFLDSSTNNFTITRNGNTTQGTFSPYGSNWSVNFTGAQTSPSLTYPSISAYDLGATSQFTYECWVYFASLSGEQSIMERWSGTGGPGWLLTKLSTNVFRAHFGSSIAIDTGAIAVAGQWTHLAVSRNGSTGSLFVNGTRQATTGSVVNFSDGTDPLVFGERNSGSQTFPLNGYISNARIVKGSNVYDPSTTTITVPTSPLTAITNTVFLGLQSNRYVDNSSNNATATASSASSVQRFSPFSPTTAYSTSVIGGSGYFDGTGDYLTLPVNAAFDLGTNACCVEAWVYLTNNNIFGIFTSSNSTSGSTRPNFYARFDQLQLDYFGNVVIQANITVTLNCWHHVVFTRASSSGAWRIFLDGVLQAYNATGSQDLLQTGAAQEVGRTYAGTTGQGYAGDVRVVNGAVPSAYVTSSTTVGATIFTPPTAPLTAITNTSLLLNYTNAGILDNAMMNDLETAGNAQISTSVKKYGTGSLAFDGTGDRLVARGNPAFNFGSGDFTVECWLYLNSVSANQWIVGPDNTVTYPWVMQTVGTAIRFISNNAANDFRPTSFTLTTGTWNHFAVTRSGSTMRWFTNGTLNGSQTYSNSIGSDTINLQMGTTGSGSGDPLNGYIDDLRITKGVARYTSSFTAPIAAFADKGSLT